MPLPIVRIWLLLMMLLFRLLFVYLRSEICIRIFESQKLSLNCYGFYVAPNVCAVVAGVGSTVASQSLNVCCGRCCKSKCLNWAQGNDLHNNFYQFYMYIFRKTTINYPTIFPKYKIYDLYDFRWYSDCASAARFQSTFVHFSFFFHHFGLAEKESNHIWHFDHKEWSVLATLRQNDTTIWYDSDNDVATFMLAREA